MEKIIRSLHIKFEHIINTTEGTKDFEVVNFEHLSSLF